jgi:hypothetical protein
LTISDYQVNSVIKTYMKNMKSKTIEADITPESAVEDRVLISYAVFCLKKKERIGEKMTERSRRYGQEELVLPNTDCRRHPRDPGDPGRISPGRGL